MKTVLKFTVTIVALLFSSSPAFSSCEEDLINSLNSFKATCEPCASFYLGPDFIHNDSNRMLYGCNTTACNSTGEPTGYYYDLWVCPSSVVKNDDLNFLRQSVNCGSIVNTESQQLGESIPIVGADFSLKYFTGWTEAYKANYKLSIPVVRADFPTSITQVNVSVTSTDGTYDAQTFYPAGIDAEYVFNWSGLDTVGNPVNGTKTFTVEVNQVSSGLSVPSRATITLGTFRAKMLGLGGWIPSSFVYYDVNAKRIYKADGSVRNVQGKPIGSGQFLVPEEDGSTVYIFNGDGKLKYVKSGLLGTTLLTFSYNGNGHIISITDSFSRVTTFSRDLSGNLTSIVAPKGQTSVATLDANGFLSGLTNPNSESYQMSYSTQGMLESFQKPGLQTNTFTYDSSGYLIKDSHSSGYFFDLVSSLNSTNSLVSVNSSMGRTKAYSFSGNNSSRTLYHSDWSGIQNYRSYTIDANQLYETVNQNGVGTYTTSSRDERFSEGAYFESAKYLQYASASYTINKTQSLSLNDPDDPFSISSLSYQTQKDSLTINSVFNPTLKEWTHTTGVGRTSKVGLDSYERIISLKKGNLNSTTFSYTGKNLTQINQGTRQTQLSYNSTTGFLASVTDPLSKTVSYGYDNAGRLTSKILPDLRIIGYSYDSNGNLTSITPPGKPAHNFGYNSSELVNSYQPPILTGVSVVNTSYGYNSDRQLTSITRPDGAVINFYYNATTGILETFDTPAGVYSQSIDYSNGLPSSITTPAGISTSITYVANKLDSTSNYDVSSNLLWTYAPTMAATGLIQSDTATNPTGTTSVINYLYDNDERLNKAGDINLSYTTPNGLLTGTSIGSGTSAITDTYSYNSYGEITDYTAKRGTTTIYRFTLARDGSGRINGKTQTMNGTTDTYDYTFDDAGRLTETKKNTATAATYSYDSNSNRNGGTIGVQPTTATYDDQDRLNTFNTLSFTSNANGDLTSKTNNTLSQTTQYTYDVFGNLTQVQLPGGTTISYEIDGLNRRIGKKVNGVLQRRWIYMDQYRIAAELNASGTITKRFVYGSKSNIPDYMIASGVKYRIISDHLGSPRLVVKMTDGTISQRMDHDEFGRVTVNTNPDFIPFGFAAGLYDSHTQLVRFGARDYDPETGRWTSKDPILFNGGDTNLYGYVMNDPINLIDPSGLFFNVPGAAIGFISGAIGGYTSGGGWGAVVGSVVGAGVGAITPTASGAAGAAAGGVVANIIGQILGNGVAGNSLGSVDVGQAIASGFSGGTGALATSALRVGSVAGQAAVCSGVDAATNSATAPFHTGPIDFCVVATGKPCGI